jgi:hypothetical protein
MNMSDRTAVLAEAERLGFPAVLLKGGSMTVYGETQWRSFAAGALPGFLQDATAQLATMAPSIEHARGFADREAERDTRRAEAAVPDPEAAAEFEREARADFERFERERPRRMEELLREIRDLLVKR